MREIQGDSRACDVPGSFSAGAAQGLIEAQTFLQHLLCPVLSSSEAVSETERAGWVALGRLRSRFLLTFQRARHSFLLDQGSETPGGTPTEPTFSDTQGVCVI